MTEAAQEITVLQAQLALKDAEIRVRDLMIEKLKHQLAGHQRHRFGARSETADQPNLGIGDREIGEAVSAPDTPKSADAPKNKPRRAPLPPDLPRHEETLPAGEACSVCGGKLKRLGEDVTEELEYVPGRFHVRRIVRPRCACADCETMHQAPPPSRPIDRGRPGPGLLAHVMTGKYGDHLPIYRQSQFFARDCVVSVLFKRVRRSIFDHLAAERLRGSAVFA